MQRTRTANTTSTFLLGTKVPLPLASDVQSNGMDLEGIFRIGVAVGDKPEGPFKPEAEPISGSYTIDPASFVDDDGQGYLYVGGLWGGQLQCWQDERKFDGTLSGPKEPSGPGVKALLPRVAKLSEDMLSFVDGVKEVLILDENGEPIKADDHDRRFEPTLTPIFAMDSTCDLGSSKPAGCTNETALTTSLTPLETPTISFTPQAPVPWVLSRTQAGSWNLS